MCVFPPFLVPWASGPAILWSHGWVRKDNDRMKEGAGRQPVCSACRNSSSKQTYIYKCMHIYIYTHIEMSAPPYRVSVGGQYPRYCLLHSDMPAPERENANFRAGPSTGHGPLLSMHADCLSAFFCMKNPSDKDFAEDITRGCGCTRPILKCWQESGLAKLRSGGLVFTPAIICKLLQRRRRVVPHFPP